MPKYDKNTLTEQARKLGFVTTTFEKMTRLTEILRFINDNNELKESLALKGGTAINLALFNLPRLSVDIDLDFTENLAKEETRIRRDRINDLLERYMAAEGYAKHRQSKRTHILDSYVCSFINAAGNSDNIKVEINYSLRAHVLPATNITTQTPEVFAPFRVRTLTPVEIFASKIVALSDRAAARDLYDLNSMVCFNLFDEPELKLLRKCAVFYIAVSGDVTLQGINFERIADITAYKVKADLHPMIRSAERFNLQTARKRVSAFLYKWMKLTENEALFLRSFASGLYRPELLFEEYEIIKRIENHPMVLWRLQKIQK